ncbi:MAG: VOC family protein [Caulobacteraceae bacterium]
MSDFKPDGWPTLIPRLFSPDVAGAVAFIKHVFGATGEARAAAPAELRIGEAMVMVSDGAGPRGEHRAFLYVYVPDADAAHAKAVARGARTIEAPLDTPYGDRRAMVEDPWGNIWQIATRTRGAS